MFILQKRFSFNFGTLSTMMIRATSYRLKTNRGLHSMCLKSAIMNLHIGKTHDFSREYHCLTHCITFFEIVEIPNTKVKLLRCISYCYIIFLFLYSLFRYGIQDVIFLFTKKGRQK